MATRRSWDLAHVALLLYLVSLCLPAITVVEKPLLGGDSSVRVLFGAQCFVMGWAVLPGWLANPLFAIAYGLHRGKRHPAAAVLLLFAVLSAILALVLLSDISISRLEHVLVGYVVWLASIFVLLIAVIIPPRFRATLEP